MKNHAVKVRVKTVIFDAFMPLNHVKTIQARNTAVSNPNSRVFRVYILLAETALVLNSLIRITG
ncbi:hypothetical protein GCM10028816_51530 [Spirosoma lituiforme]